MADIDVGELRGRVSAIESRLDRIEGKLDRMIEEISGMSGGRKALIALLSITAAFGAACIELAHTLWGHQ